MNHHSLIAIDLAKNVFQVCIVNSSNHVLLNKSLSRKALPEFMINQAPSTVAMEACYSSHYWARLFEAYGSSGKTVARTACEAICSR